MWQSLYFLENLNLPNSLKDAIKLSEPQRRRKSRIVTKKKNSSRRHNSKRVVGSKRARDPGRRSTETEFKFRTPRSLLARLEVNPGQGSLILRSCRGCCCSWLAAWFQVGGTTFKLPCGCWSGTCWTSKLSESANADRRRLHRDKLYVGERRGIRTKVKPKNLMTTITTEKKTHVTRVRYLQRGGDIDQVELLTVGLDSGLV